MALGSLSGYARVSTTSPIGQAICDRCGVRINRTKLRRQFYWRGVSLADSGYLVCPRCEDLPNQQYRALILPGDPRPFQTPRPDPAITPQSWVNGVVSPPTVSPPSPTPYNFRFLDYQIGSIVDQTYPTIKQSVLASVASATGVSTPADYMDGSIIFGRQSTSQVLLDANSDRTWLVVWNPTQVPAVFSTSDAVFGSLEVLTIGPGQAWFQADALAGVSTYKGPLTAAGLRAGAPLWVWEAPFSPGASKLINNGGFIVFANDAPFPKSPVGLLPGAIWSNGGFVCIVLPTAPNPFAPPIILGHITAISLVSQGGGNLPLTDPADGTLTMWNNAGFVCVGTGGLYSNGGVLTLNALAGYPTSTAGLPAGAVWSNSHEVGVVPVASTVPPRRVFFGYITAAELLAQGANGFPTTSPTAGSGQLWNNGNVVSIA